MSETTIAPPPAPPDFPVVASGRRKTAVATVWLSPGSGRIEVNGRGFEDYFGSVATQAAVLQPLQIVEGQSKYDIRIKAEGGGNPGQAGAVRMALARALIKVDPTSRGALKAQGCLRRDSRMKERKKSGQPGARKRFQFSKR
jgi:small subunit ribosomal protein S9